MLILIRRFKKKESEFRSIRSHEIELIKVNTYRILQIGKYKAYKRLGIENIKEYKRENIQSLVLYNVL